MGVVGFGCCISSKLLEMTVIMVGGWSLGAEIARPICDSSTVALYEACYKRVENRRLLIMIAG